MFTFDNINGNGALQFDPSANPFKFALTDWIAYDVNLDYTVRPIAGEHMMPGQNPPTIRVGEQPVLLELGFEPAQIESLVQRARPAAASLIGIA